MREVSHLIILGDKSLMKSIWRRHLIICLFPWAAGGSHLPPGSGVHRRKRRGQLDHPGFPGAYLLDLHHIARHPRHLKFNCRPVISPARSVAHSLWLNGAFPDPARRRLRRLRKSPARGARRQRAHHPCICLRLAARLPPAILQTCLSTRPTRTTTASISTAYSPLLPDLPN